MLQTNGSHASGFAVPSLFSSLLLAGCGVRELPPPPPPRAEVPNVPGAPTDPPERGQGRLVVDANGERATVSRVVETIEGPVPQQQGDAGFALKPSSGLTVATETTRTELLCITPCVLDLRQGAHALVFTSTNDPHRTSTATIAVTAQPSVVRHAIGRKTPLTAGYLGCAGMVLLGAGLTLMGGLATTVGLAAKPEYNDAGQVTNDPRPLVPFGLVLAGVGLVLGTTGIIVAANNRPELQPGSTTQFRLP